MRLEGYDPVHESIIAVLSVSQVLASRIRLHFDGYDYSHDFWRNADSALIFPVGYCQTNGLKLMPPLGYESSEFDWAEYLYDKVAAPKSLFTNNYKCQNVILVNA